MPPSSSQPNLTSAQFLDHLARESARFRAVLADAPAGVRVPTCPDWDVDDLLWHLGEVQWFWGEIAERGLTTGEQVEAMNADRDPRPADRHGLLDFYDRSSERLRRVLSGLAPETELWMWSDDHSAGYIARRQAHEALIHRLDAELTAGVERAPFDPQLAADGVHEALTIMRGYEQEGGLTHTSTGAAVLLTATGVTPLRMWSLVPVRVTGTSEGEPVDVTRLLVESVDLPEPGDGRPAEVFIPGAASVEGCPEDLDCWLWNRPLLGTLRRQGNAAALAAVDQVVTGAID